MHAPEDAHLLIGGYGQEAAWLRHGPEGRLSKVSAVPMAFPSCVVYDAGRGVLHAVLEDEQAPAGQLASVSSAPAPDGAPDVTKPVTGPTTSGETPCHLSLHPDGTHVFVANYGGGSVAVFPVDDDGLVSVDGPSQLIRHTGHGPDTGRQEGPHAHMAQVSPSGRYVLAVDLGNDTIYVYRYDADQGRLLPHSTTELPGGTGPRHLAFHGSGEFVYVIGELDYTVTVCTFSDEDGTLVPGDSWPVRADDAPTGRPVYPAAIRVSADDRFLYASNRVDDTVVVWEIRDFGAALERIQTIACGGSWPRDIALSRDGSLLFAANQKSDSITVFAVDAETGRLTMTGEPFTIAAPTSVFVL
jgi:6-phosphogluconolactonase (cycloisomerase 2 family)